MYEHEARTHATKSLTHHVNISKYFVFDSSMDTRSYNKYNQNSYAWSNSGNDTLSQLSKTEERGFLGDRPDGSSRVTGHKRPLNDSLSKEAQLNETSCKYNEGWNIEEWKTFLLKYCSLKDFNETVNRFGELCFVRMMILKDNHLGINEWYFPAIIVPPMEVKGKEKDSVLKNWVSTFQTHGNGLCIRANLVCLLGLQCNTNALDNDGIAFPDFVPSAGGYAVIMDENLLTVEQALNDEYTELPSFLKTKFSRVLGKDHITITGQLLDSWEKVLTRGLIEAQKMLDSVLGDCDMHRNDKHRTTMNTSNERNWSLTAKDKNSNDSCKTTETADITETRVDPSLKSSNMAPQLVRRSFPVILNELENEYRVERGHSSLIERVKLLEVSVFGKFKEFALKERVVELETAHKKHRSVLDEMSRLCELPIEKYAIFERIKEIEEISGLDYSTMSYDSRITALCRDLI